MSRAIVVAHPDDETIFAASLMLDDPGGWHVYCMTHALDAREQHFRRSAQALGFEGHIFNVGDEGMLWTPAQVALARENLGPRLDQHEVIYTHGAKGDYGHPHHVSLHDIVIQLRPDAYRFHHDMWLGVAPAEPRHETIRIPVPPGKAGIFQATYGAILYRNLTQDHPEMMEHYFTRHEEFTR